MTQNLNRLPIVSDTSQRWEVAENPFGDGEEAGFYAVRHCPVQRDFFFEGPGHDTKEDCAKWIEDNREFY